MKARRAQHYGLASAAVCALLALPGHAFGQTAQGATSPLTGGLRGSSPVGDPVLVNTTRGLPTSNLTGGNLAGSDPNTTGSTAANPPNGQTIAPPRAAPAVPISSANPIGPVGPPDSSLAATGAETVSAPAGPSFSPEPLTDPYAPQPLRIGSFNVNGEASLTYGRSSNLSNSAGGTQGRFGRFGFEGGAVSDWSRHQLRLSSAAEVDLNRGAGRNRDTDLDLAADLRLDVGGASSIGISATYGLFTEDASSPDALITGNDNPFLSEYALGVTYERNAGLVGLQLRGGLTAARYGDIKIAGQPAVSQNQRDRNGATLGGRLSYNGGGRITPFVDAEYELGRRVTPLDANGFDRRFNGMRAAIGAQVEVTGKLAGSLEVGYGRRDFADVRLPDIGGLVVNGNLDWQANDQLRVGLNLNTDFSGQSTAGVSGSIARGAGASIDWQATEALALGLTAGVSRTDYSNGQRDNQYTVSGTADYWLTPHAGLTGQVTRTRLNTNRVGAAYSATEVELGLKVRH
ncbi:MAG: outer membrane beta-barrel protein [Pseudomonadota bacterium]